MTDAEARADALYADPPWRLPKPLPPPATGDAQLDALFLALDGKFEDAASVDKSATELAGNETLGVRDTALAWVEHIIRDRPPVLPDDYSAVPPDVRAIVNERNLAARNAWALRTWVFSSVLKVLTPRDDDVVRDAFARYVELDAAPRLVWEVAEALFRTLPEGPSRNRWLDGLVRHFVPGDPLAPRGVDALVIRDGTAAAPRIRTTFDAMDDTSRVHCAISLSRRKEVDLDAFPDWADILYPKVLGVPWALEAFYPLHAVKTAEPLLRALRYTDEDVYWTDMLASLRRVDDPSSADRLEEIAKTLPTQPKGEKKRSRTSNTVLALVKRLRRKRDVVDRASFETKPGVGTDGGPILVLGEDAARAWQGVPADWNGDGESDYDRACAATDVEDELGKLVVDGKRALVIGEQGVGLAMLADGVPMLVVRGTDLQIEIAMRERGAWKKKRREIDVGGQGLVLLDAVHTLASATEGAVVHVPLPRGPRDVYELRTDDVLAVKLPPSRARAARKA